MGREVRRVMPGWEHPRDENGEYIPMHAHFTYQPDDVAEGLRDGWLSGDPPFYGVPVMPQWTPWHATAYQLYESTTEGTPLSPVFADREGLVHWLTEPHEIGIGHRPVTLTREAAEHFVDAGYAPSTVYSPATGLISGIEYENELVGR